MDSFRYVKYLIDKEGYKMNVSSTHQYIEIFRKEDCIKVNCFEIVYG